MFMLKSWYFLIALHFVRGSVKCSVIDKAFLYIIKQVMFIILHIIMLCNLASLPY